MVRKGAPQKSRLWLLVAGAVAGVAAIGTVSSTRHEKAALTYETASAHQDVRQSFLDTFPVSGYTHLVYDPGREKTRKLCQSLQTVEGALNLQGDAYSLRIERRPFKPAELERYVSEGLMQTQFDIIKFAQKESNTVFVYTEAFDLYAQVPATNPRRAFYRDVIFRSGIDHELQHAKDAYQGFVLGDGYVDNEIARILYATKLFFPLLELRGNEVQIKKLLSPEHIPPDMIQVYCDHFYTVVRRASVLPQRIGKNQIRHWIDQFLTEQKRDPVLGK